MSGSPASFTASDELTETKVGATDVDVVTSPEHALILYTDGVTEARRGREMYGEDRLRRLVAGLDGSAAAVAERIEADVVDYSQGHQSDDTAILVIRVPPPPSPPEPELHGRA